MRVPRLNILIIDDSDSDAALVSRHLKRVHAFEADVALAASHEEGLRTLEDAEADCVVLDYRLGPQCGLETLRAIRKRGDDTPVVFVTGFGSEMVAVEALQCGAQDYLVKSVISPDVLQRAVLNAVEKVSLSRSVRAKQRELEDFVSVVAHDLQQPLCAVKGNVELIRDFYNDRLDRQAMEFVEAAVRTSSRMAEMIEALLRYARAGRQRAPLEDLDMNELAGAVKADLRGLISETAAVVEIADLPSVAGDPVTLAQLLQNLISNAIKFRGDEIPCIIVAGEQLGKRVHIQVRDNGMGIPASSLEEVFAPFRRLAQAKGRPGSGIGLATCKKIVEQHDGRIWAESELGVGSTFHIDLPASIHGEDHHAEGEEWRVLLVDEDASGAELIAHALERERVEVVYAADVEHAASLLELGGFEGVILDLTASSGRAIDWIDQVRRAAPDVSILAVTAGDGRSAPGPLLAEARRRGAHHVLPKPLDGQQVASLLRRMIVESRPRTAA
ncbi:MAG: response regulator [Bryobacterales bacterium]